MSNQNESPETPINLVNSSNKEETVLDVAEKLGHTEIVKYLKEHPELSINLVNSSNKEETVLDVAKEPRNKNIKNMLDSLRNSSDEVQSKPKKSI